MPLHLSHSKTITLLNRKGGVGKTHVTWLMASCCVECGLRCLVIDLDPQANFTGSVLNEEPERSIAAIFDASCEPDLKGLIQHTRWKGLDIVPSSSELERFNTPDETAWQQGDLQLSLTEAIASVADQYDYILFDCPPTLSLVSYAALCAANFLVVPLEAARWGALGTQHVITAMEYVQATTNPDLRLLGYVVSRYKARRAYQQTYRDELFRQFEDDVFQTVIPDLAAFEKAVTDRVPITVLLCRIVFCLHRIPRRQELSGDDPRLLSNSATASRKVRVDYPASLLKRMLQMQSALSEKPLADLFASDKSRLKAEPLDWPDSFGSVGGCSI